MSRGSWYKVRPQHEPDAIDCCSMLNEIGSKFGLICRIDVDYGLDFVTVMIKAGTFPDVEHFDVVFQAINKRPARDKRSRDAQVYATLWDIYQQADNGIAGMNVRPQYRPI